MFTNIYLVLLLLLAGSLVPKFHFQFLDFGNSLSVAVPSKVKKCFRACVTPVIPP